MANPTQLRRVRVVGTVDIVKEWPIFIFSTVTERKILLIISYLDQDSGTKTTEIGIYIMFTTPRK
jgi:hypothetical protein